MLSPMSHPFRWALAIIVAGFLMAVFSTDPAFAQTAGETIMEDNYGIATKLIALVNEFNTRAAAITAVGTPYYNRALFLLGGFVVFRLVIATVTWVFNAKGYDLAAVFLQVVFVIFLFPSFVPITNIISNYAWGISSVIQESAIGTQDFSGPLQYMIAQVQSFDIEADGIFGAVVKALYDIFTALVVGVFMLCVMFALYLPTTLLFIQKIIGLLLVPTILLPQLNFLFQGWIRVFLSTILFIILARISVLAVIFLMGILLGDPYVGPGPGGVVAIAPKVMKVNATSLLAMFAAIFALASFLLVASGQMAARIAGGIDGGLGAGLSAAFTTKRLAGGLKGVGGKVGK